MHYKQGRELKEFDFLYKEIDESYHNIALSLGLTDTAFLILYCLVELGDGCLQKDICEMYCMSKQTVNSSVKSLETKGFLKRVAGKGRDMHLFFTDCGLEFANRHIGPVIEMENHTFACMPEQEREELLRLTRKYSQIFKEHVQLFLEENSHAN
ncbi:MAG: MarR family winged helix-turn-helix transcriptional regulator [Anaerostipes sp.]|uniref:MarR family winged helix-turn-helix transcriptional regulator n=1 Tax=Anaerostipes sp. TaxID=1872530 RepID=UPI0039934C97